MPTKKQLHRSIATQVQYPSTRREDDPSYVAPKRRTMLRQTSEKKAIKRGLCEIKEIEAGRVKAKTMQQLMRELDKPTAHKRKRTINRKKKT